LYTDAERGFKRSTEKRVRASVFPSPTKQASFARKTAEGGCPHMGDSANSIAIEKEEA
jgi:hypothetical protein